MRARSAVLGLALIGCGGGAGTAPAPATSAGAEHAATPSPLVGRYDGSAGGRSLHVVIDQEGERLVGTLEIRHESPARCAIEQTADAAALERPRVTFECVGPDGDDPDSTPRWQGTTELGLADGALTGDFGLGPVAIPRTVLPPPPTDGSIVDASPFLGQRTGTSEMADETVSLDLREQAGRVVGTIETTGEATVHCDVREPDDAPRAPGRLVLSAVCTCAEDAALATSGDCTLEVLPSGVVTSDDCWDTRTEVDVVME